MLMPTRLVRALRVCAAITFIALSTSGCVTAYVDSGLQQASLADVRKPARPTDVQLLFQFQTKGTANAKATDILRKEVGELISSSGLFATLGTDPADATVAATFVVTRNGASVYDKLISVAHEWDSSFIGAIAIPEAINQYTQMYARLLEKLFADEDFKKAVAPIEKTATAGS
jgi:hypothetical protein